MKDFLKALNIYYSYTNNLPKSLKILSQSEEFKEISQNANMVKNEADGTRAKTKESINISNETAKRVSDMSNTISIMMEDLKDTSEISQKNRDIAKVLSDISDRMLKISKNLDSELSQFRVD